MSDKIQEVLAEEAVSRRKEGALDLLLYIAKQRTVDYISNEYDDNIDFEDIVEFEDDLLRKFEHSQQNQPYKIFLSHVAEYVVSEDFNDFVGEIVERTRDAAKVYEFTIPYSDSITIPVKAKSREVAENYVKQMDNYELKEFVTDSPGAEFDLCGLECEEYDNDYNWSINEVIDLTT